MPAIAAVGVLDVVVIGFVFLLLLLAARQLFGPVFEGALSQIPLVGGWISGNVNTLVVRLIVRAAAVGAQSLSPVADLIRRVRAATGIYTWDVIYALEDHFDVSWRILHLSLPAAVKGATDYAAQLYNQAANLDFLYSQALYAYAKGLYDQAVTLEYHLFQTATDYAAQLYNAAANLAAIYYGLAVSEARRLFGLSVAYTDQQIRGTDSYVAALHDQAIRFTQDATASAERYAQQVGADAEGYARALQGQAIRYADQIGAQATTYAQALALPIAAAVMAIERSPCQQFCNPLGELGQLLQGLEDLGLAALLIGLAEASVHDPQGTANEIRALVQPVSQELAQLTVGQIGLRAT